MLGISERWLRQNGSKSVDSVDSAPVLPDPEKKFYEELLRSKPALIDEKVKLHGRIIDEFNLSLLDKVSAEELRGHVKRFVSDYVVKERVTLNQMELEAFTDEVMDEMVGLGPI